MGHDPILIIRLRQVPLRIGEEVARRRPHLIQYIPHPMFPEITGSYPLIYHRTYPFSCMFQE